MTSALAEEAVLPTLHNLILAEVYLSGGPVDVFRLWSEMYERQKTIDVGTLLFVRAIAHLEEQGFLQKVSESKSAITGKGEAYLASTANILDVAQNGQKEGIVCQSHVGRKLVNQAAEQGLQSSAHGGAAVKNTAIQPNAGRSMSSLKERNGVDVADRATGNAPVTDGLQVGDEGVSDCGELPLGADAAGTDALGRRLATHPLRNEQLADSQNSTPLYLLASEIVDKVTKGYEQ